MINTSKRYLKKAGMCAILAIIAASAIGLGARGMTSAEGAGGNEQFYAVGAAVRILGEGADNGIRFDIKLDKGYYASVTADGGTLATGVLAVPEILLTGELTREQAGDGTDGKYAVDKDLTGLWEDNGDGYVDNYAFLYNLPADVYDVNVAFRGYIVNEEGTVVYTDTLVRSMSEVAFEAISADPSLDGLLGEYLYDYTVTFVNSPDTPAETVRYGGKAALPETPDKTGYEFIGWYADAEFSTPFDFENTLIKGDTSVYGKFERIPAEYTMNYSLEGKKYPVGMAITLPSGSAAEGSGQDLSFKYYVDGTESTDGTATVTTEGEHTFKAEVIWGGEVVETVEETFTAATYAEILADYPNFVSHGYERVITGDRLPPTNFGYNTLSYVNSVEDAAGAAADAFKWSASQPGQAGYNFSYIDDNLVKAAIAAGYTTVTLTYHIPYDGTTSTNNGYSIFKDTEADMLVWCGGGADSLSLADEWYTRQFNLSEFAANKLGFCPFGPEFYISRISFGGNLTDAIASGINFAEQWNGFSDGFFTGPRIPATNTISYGDVQAADGETKYAMTINIASPANQGYNYTYFNLDIIKAAIAAGKTKINITYSVVPSEPRPSPDTATGIILYIGGNSKIYNGGMTGWSSVSYNLSDFNTESSTSNFFIGTSKTMSFASITFE